MKLTTEPGRIFLQLVSEKWSTDEAAAVAEISARKGSRSKPITVPIAVNAAPLPVDVEPGEYTVRMYLPSGDVLSQSVRVGGDRTPETRIGFDLARSPHEWLSSETAFGAVQQLPNAARAQALEAWRSSEAAARIFESTTAARVSQAISDYHSAFQSLERVSGVERVKSISGRCRFSRIDPARPFADSRLSTKDLVSWWAGYPENGEGIRLQISKNDDRNAKLSLSVDADSGFELITGERRAFAAVVDPTGNWHYAVFPQGWRSTSRPSPDESSRADLLMTVVIESVMRESDDSEEPAKWRCSSAVSDVEAMTYMGFLYSGQATAAEFMIKRASDLLFEKKLNPVAAAAGAFGLLAFSPPEESSNPRWQQWIRNLHTLYPRLPDAAIAMAQLYVRHGEGKQGGEDLDVEKLRAYVLEAVRRGLPYLSYAVRPLSEMLLMLVTDDQEHKRKGALVEDTRHARRLVQQLERLLAPGSFFTVLDTADEEP